jgi:hypothetical protein
MCHSKLQGFLVHAYLGAPRPQVHTRPSRLVHGTCTSAFGGGGLQATRAGGAVWGSQIRLIWTTLFNYSIFHDSMVAIGNA